MPRRPTRARRIDDGLSLNREVRFTRLNNGVRIVTESVPGAASVTAGLWIENGSRYESERVRGVSHFIEHMLFKGTPTRSALRIAEEIESVGGSINAFTGKESTCYHTRTPAGELGRSLDVLADMFLNSNFHADDIELEREVILQEIYDAEDMPEDSVHDYFLESYWPGHPLGWAVAGTVDTVASLSAEDIVAFRNDRYRPDRVVIAASGALDHDRFVELCRERFVGIQGSFEPGSLDRPDVCPGLFVRSRDLEQVHIVVGFPGIMTRDPRRYAADLMISALGGGMSSRLFQKIREQRGKAYTVYAFQSAFREIGYTGVYAATSRDAVGEVVDLTLETVSRIAEEGLDAQELERSKSQIIGSIPLSLESTENRMFRVARNRMFFDREISIEEVTRTIAAVSNEEIIEVAREIFSFDRLGVALLGDADARMVSLPAT